MSALGVTQNIQVISSLQVDEFVHGWVMDLGDLWEAIVYYFLTIGMTNLGHRDESHVECTIIYSYT